MEIYMNSLKIAAGLCLALSFAAHAEDAKTAPSRADECVADLTKAKAAQMPGEEEQIVLISGQDLANIKTQCEDLTQSTLVTMKDVPALSVLKPGRPSNLVIE
jgi:hypothetical protein